MTAFDPYYTWLGIPPEDQPADYYRLLGVKKLESNLDVISHAADKQMMHLRSFQTGQHAQASQKLLNELAAVRVCLLNPEKKADYDEQLRSQIKPAVPVLEVARSAASSDVNLPRAPLLGSAKPTRPQRPSTTVQSDGIPEVNFRSPNSDAKPFPKWMLAAAGVGVGVIVVAGLAFFMLRGSSAGSPVAQASSASSANASTQLAGAEVEPTVEDRSSVEPSPTSPSAEQSSDIVARGIESESPSPPAPLPGTGRGEKLDTPIEPPTSLKVNGISEPPTSPEANATQEQPASPVASTTPAEPVVEDSSPEASASAEEASETSQVAQAEAPAGETKDSNEDSAASETAETSDKRLPPPSLADIAGAESLVNEIFGDEIAAAKTADQRSELASKMIQSADGTDAADAARYVLLTKASEYAALAGNSSLIESACDNLAEQYELDVLRLKGRAYSDASKGNFDIKISGELCDQVLALADKAGAEQRFELTQPLIKVAQIFARKVKNKDLFKQINEQSERLAALQSDFLASEKAAKLLVDNPNDAAANLAYGKFLAISKNDWEQALPLLVKGGDPALKAAAEADLAAPEKASAQAELGDAWYNLAKENKSMQGFFGRAHYWYELALPTLTGLVKTRVEKRLDETQGYASSAVATSSPVAIQGPITAKARMTIPAHNSHVISLAFSPNSRMLASGSIVEDIKLWDVSTGEPIKTLSGPKDIRSLIFSPDGKTLISADGDYVGRFWTIPAGQMQREIKDCSNVAASGDGKTLAVFNPHTGTTTLWDAASVRQSVVLETVERYGAPYMSKDGKLLAASIYPESKEPIIYVWNTQTGRVIHKLPAKANLMAFSPDGKLLVSSSYQGQLSIWNIVTGAEKHTMKGDNDYVTGMAFSPDGGTLVTGGAAKVLRFWDPQTGKLRVDVPDADGYISSIAFSPNGKTICTGSFSKQITLWDVEKLTVSPGEGAKK